MKAWARALFLLGVLIAPAASFGQPITAELSTDRVEISTGFTGASVLVFGATQNPLGGDPPEDLIVVATGPTQGVVNGPEQARQAVRQRYKDGSDVIKITATGGVMSYAKSGDAPQFTVDEIRAIVDIAKDYGYSVAAHAHGSMKPSHGGVVQMSGEIMVELVTKPRSLAICSPTGRCRSPSDARHASRASSSASS